MILPLFLALTSPLAHSTELLTELPRVERVTVLARERIHTLAEAFVRASHLWVPVSALPKLTGFRLKPEGFCAAELCVPLTPLPDGAQWTEQRDDRTFVDVTAFAELVGQASANSTDGSVWSLAPVPLLASPLLEGQAPDFELFDREGNAVRLSDFRGSKVLLLTWASW